MVAPITAPWSAALARNEDKRDVVIGTSPLFVAGKIVIGFGANVPPKNRQSIKGIFELLLRFLKNNNYRLDWEADTYIKAVFERPSYSSITTTSVAPTADEVSIAISGTFADSGAQGGSHFQEETVNQLLRVLHEASAGT